MRTTRRRVHKKNDLKNFDKYDLYHKSVQSAESDVVFFRDVYKQLKKKDPKTLREDFSGTFSISCEWVKLNKNHKSYAVDLDPEPLEYGKKNNLSKLKELQQSRVQVIEGNVLSSHLPHSDIIVAMNFSYFIFKSREMMKKYFTNAFKLLRKDGVFICDVFGGSDCFDENEETTNYKKFMYYWDQEGFDPVTNEAKFHIHFKVKGQKKVEHVFTYDWRMWSIPELKDILEEVGFKKVHVYWEGTTKKGEGDGNFTRVEHGEACQSWIAYIAAEK